MGNVEIKADLGEIEEDLDLDHIQEEEIEEVEEIVEIINLEEEVQEDRIPDLLLPVDLDQIEDRDQIKDHNLIEDHNLHINKEIPQEIQSHNQEIRSNFFNIIMS